MIDVFVLCYYQHFAYPFIRLIFSENMKSSKHKKKKKHLENFVKIIDHVDKYRLLHGIFHIIPFISIRS
jgi:hypothetical protein